MSRPTCAKHVTYHRDPCLSKRIPRRPRRLEFSCPAVIEAEPFYEVLRLGLGRWLLIFSDVFQTKQVSKQFRISCKRYRVREETFPVVK